MYCHSEAKTKPPRQVAPSPPRYACHLSRFNGRAYFGRVVYRGLYARKNSPILTVARFYVVVIIEISAFEFRFVRLFDDGAGMNRLLIGLFVAFRRLFVGNYLVLVVFHFYFFKHTISTAISAGFTPDMREA